MQKALRNVVATFGLVLTTLAISSNVYANNHPEPAIETQVTSTSADDRSQETAESIPTADTAELAEQIATPASENVGASQPSVQTSTDTSLDTYPSLPEPIVVNQPPVMVQTEPINPVPVLPLPSEPLQTTPAPSTVIVPTMVSEPDMMLVTTQDTQTELSPSSVISVRRLSRRSRAS